MKMYLTIISVCGLMIASIVALATHTPYLVALGFTVFAVVLVILVDGLVATIARLLPKKCANHEYKVFSVSLKEKKFYEKLKIRKWKEKVPEIGHFTGFRKNKIIEPKNVEYLNRFLLEICYGEIGHFFGVFFGFVILLIHPIHHAWLAISIPVAIINGILNIPLLFVLRYNSFKLENLRRFSLRRQQRQVA